MQMVLIIQIRYYYNEHASWVMWCLCAFFSLSCNFIVVAVCQPLGSKAFYFTYASVWHCAAAGTIYTMKLCVYCYCPFFFFFFFIFIAFVPPPWKAIAARAASALNGMCFCAPLYELNVIEIVILPIEFGRRPILLGHKWLLCFFSLFLQLEKHMRTLFGRCHSSTTRIMNFVRWFWPRQAKISFWLIKCNEFLSVF